MIDLEVLLCLLPNKTIYSLLSSYADIAFAFGLLKQPRNYLPFTVFNALLFILHVQKYKPHHILDTTITIHKKKS